MRRIVLAACVLAFVVGCSTAPVQKPTQTIAPDSTTAAALRDVQAQTVALAQQNTAIINAIQKSAQDADQFRTEVKGAVSNMTQNQFRFESWWATVSARLRPRLLGFSGFTAVEVPAGVHNELGKPDNAGGAGGADGVGNPTPVQVKKGPSMLELLIAFILGAVALSVVSAEFPAIAATVEAKEGGIIAWVVGIIKALWQMIFGKKAAVAAPPAAPPTPPTPPAAGT